MKQNNNIINRTVSDFLDKEFEFEIYINGELKDTTKIKPGQSYTSPEYKWSGEAPSYEVKEINIPAEYNLEGIENSTGTLENNTISKVKAKKAACKGENVETEIDISIEDAFRGKEQTIGVRTVEGKLKKFKVQVPAGIRNNEKIRIVGQGKPGVSGGKPGDLFIKVKIKNDERFILEGYDIKTNLYLTPWEAALSTKVTINGINEDVSVYVPAGIQSGEKIEIENKGYKDGKGGRGKLILDTKIMIPKRPNEEELKLFKEFEKMSKFNPRNS